MTGIHHMKTSRYPILSVLVNLAMLFAVLTVQADVVTTSDGSRLLGVVEKIADGRLVILTNVAGRLEIKADLISALTTDEPVHIVMQNDDAFVGPLVATDQTDVVVIRTGQGDKPLSISTVVLLWPVGTEDPGETAARKNAEAEAKAARPKWTIKLEGGATRKEGNTDTLEAHGRFNVKRTTKYDLWHLYLAGRFSEQNKSRTVNEYYGGARYENTREKRSYWYARTELEFDEFEDIDLRATAAAGVGYYWLKQPQHELKTSGGVGYRYEAFDDGRTEEDVVIDLGLDYRRDLDHWLQFTHAASYSPDAHNFSDYRLTLDTAMLMPFQNDRLAWKLGMRNEYNSQPQPGLKRLDNTYYTSIVWTLR